MTETFFIFAGWMVAVLVSVAAAQPMARARRRDPEGWILLCAFLGPLALLLLKLLGEAPPATAEQRARNAAVSTVLGGLLIVALALVMLVPAIKGCFRL